MQRTRSATDKLLSSLAEIYNEWLIEVANFSAPLVFDASTATEDFNRFIARTRAQGNFEKDERATDFFKLQGGF